MLSKRSSVYLAAFDSELASPTLKSAGVVSNFMTGSRAAGPGLALFSAVPAGMEAYQASKEDPDAPEYDEAGNLIPDSEKKRIRAEKKKDRAGRIGGGLGSVVGTLGSFALPAMAGPIGWVAPVAAAFGGSWAGKRIGEAVGS